MNKVADSVKKKLILSCKRIGLGVRGGFNSGGSVAEQLGTPADL